MTPKSEAGHRFTSLASTDFPLAIEILVLCLLVVLIGGIFWVIFMMFRQGIAELTGRRQRDRRNTGLCVQCGYDLRASEGSCPECGAPKSLQKAPKPPRQTDHDLDVRRLSSDWPNAPVDPAAPDPKEPLVQLIVSSDGWGMQLLVDQLIARGVWAAIQEQERSELRGSFVSHTVWNRVVVPQTDLDLARAVLERFKESDTDDDISDEDEV